jgi:hypothetical protein
MSNPGDVPIFQFERRGGPRAEVMLFQFARDPRGRLWVRQKRASYSAFEQWGLCHRWFVVEDETRQTITIRDHGPSNFTFTAELMPMGKARLPIDKARIKDEEDED